MFPSLAAGLVRSSGGKLSYGVGTKERGGCLSESWRDVIKNKVADTFVH